MTVVFLFWIFAFFSSSVWCHVPFPQPGFLSSPINFETSINDTIVLPCTVHDLGKNVLRWWKDDLLLSDSSDDSLISPPKVTLLTNNMLLVEKLQVVDAGDYKCEILRAYPRPPLELIHTVRVRHPPQITTIPADGIVEVLLGGEVQMGCMASGWPAPAVTWKFKDEVMKATDNRHKLIFIANEIQQSGVYVCEADNKIGRPAASSVVVKILYPPEIKVDKTWVHSSPGMQTNLECTVTGEPRPKITWLFGGQPLSVDSSRMTHRIRGNKHILTFRIVQDTDFGEYSCRATNKVGETEENIILSGLAYPAVFKNGGVVSPDSYSLIWEVDSYSSIIEYKLLFKEASSDGDWIQLIIPADANSPGPLHSKSYTLSGLKLFRTYKARVMSRNRFGWSESSDIITFGSEGDSQSVEDKVTPVSGQITSGAGQQRNLHILVLIVLCLLHTLPVNL